MTVGLPSTPLTDPGLWLAGSLIAAILATNLAFLVVRLGQKRQAPEGAMWLLAALAWLLSSLFLLLPPLAAWRSGAISPYQLGLAELTWVEDLRAGGSLVVPVAGLTVFAWLVYRRSLRADRVPWQRNAWGPAWRAPLDAALQQWHWAFYRAAAIGWLTAIAPGVQGALLQWAMHGPPGATALAALAGGMFEQPLYWGTWLGLVSAGLEWALNPFARANLRSTGPRELALLRASLALSTAAIFTLARNFWLCLACHLAVETIIVGWLSPPIETTKDD